VSIFKEIIMNNKTKSLLVILGVIGGTIVLAGTQQSADGKAFSPSTINVNASHASYVSHPDEITQLILNVAKGK
jgi:hypothetical protein